MNDIEIQSDAVRIARALRISSEINKLGRWCLKRSGFPHCAETTISMLEAKTEELITRVNKAGWKANASGQPHPTEHDKTL